VLLVFKIKDIFGKKSSTQKCAERGSFSGGARKNIGGGPTKYTLIYKHKFFSCNKR